jgi:hypothetical protein
MKAQANPAGDRPTFKQAAKLKELIGAIDTNRTEDPRASLTRNLFSQPVCATRKKPTADCSFISWVLGG